MRSLSIVTMLTHDQLIKFISLPISMESSSQASSRNPTHVLSRAIDGSFPDILSFTMAVQHRNVSWADHKDDDTLRRHEKREQRVSLRISESIGQWLHLCSHNTDTN